jgi:DNA-binding response OmpR family regulator
MPPLLTGELKLLRYLGAHSQTWHSSHELSLSVYQRDDAAARQLVWKYASMLRKKLAPSLPELIEHCRRRGYRCREQLLIASADRHFASAV